MKTKLKTSDKIVIIIAIAIVALISYDIISRAVESKRQEDKADAVCNALFVTEKAEAVNLHEAIAQLMDTPDEEHYSAALKAAEYTETVCMQTFGSNSNIVLTFGAGLNYYSTFYRDVKFALSNRLDPSELQPLNDLISEIIALYNTPAAPSSAHEKLKAAENFYNSVYLLLENNREVLLNIYE
ncbi:MAG: hypothetical protein J1F60_04630 [Oscillospiraceae bacterium]|nr:hypothetical protein [Oscillospiraceae bacterium]